MSPPQLREGNSVTSWAGGLAPSARIQRYIMFNRYEVEQIRQEAASQAINKTIRLISEGTKIPFPAIEILRSRLI